MRNGMSCSEAGRLGAKKVLKKIKEKHEEFVNSYYMNPKLCKQCGKSICFEKRFNMFCSKNCSATFNNLHGKTGRRVNHQCYGRYINNRFHFGLICKQCNKEFFSRIKEQKYCSNKCESKYRKMEKIAAVDRLGEFSPSQSVNANGEASRVFVRTYLEFKFGHKCSICGISEWNGKPITLVVDHIDGNATNNKVDNFRLVCPNCDSQLPTYKGRNKGKGRKWRSKYTNQ